MQSAQANITGPQNIGRFLDDAIAGLNRDERDVLLLRYLENHSVDETAQLLRSNPTAVAHRAIRALNKVRVLLGNKGIAIPLADLGPVLSAQSAAPVPDALMTAVIRAPESPGRKQQSVILNRGFTCEQYHQLARRIMRIMMLSSLILIGAGVVYVLAFNGIAIKNTDTTGSSYVRPIAPPAPAQQAINSSQITPSR